MLYAKWRQTVSLSRLAHELGVAHCLHSFCQHRHNLVHMLVHLVGSIFKWNGLLWNFWHGLDLEWLGMIGIRDTRNHAQDVPSWNQSLIDTWWWSFFRNVIYVVHLVCLIFPLIFLSGKMGLDSNKLMQHVHCFDIKPNKPIFLLVSKLEKLIDKQIQMDPFYLRINNDKWFKAGNLCF